jgi:Protein of unknown function (DUF3106)
VRKFFLILFLLTFPGLTISQSDIKQDPAWKEKLDRWQKLSPEQKEELRKRYEKLRAMSPEERKNFQDKAERFKSLTPEQ